MDKEITVKKILYYDCFSGISGDLNLGALVDVGVDKNYLIDELKKLNLKHYEVIFSTSGRKGIHGTKADVVIEHSSHHHHRNLNDIKKIILESSLSDNIKKSSLDIFFKIAEAEAKVHNKSIDEIHFHEVGAVDSIIDIVGAAICLDYLHVDKILASTVELGGGFVDCAHGRLPVPAPATVEILKNIPVKSGAVPFETTTPTGAAILATVVNEFTDNTNFKILKTGYGIGNRDTDIPNVLRVYLAEPIAETLASKTDWMIECNIDDMNPELYEFVFEKLFEHGAQDVFLTPIIMKKTRPANKLSVICNNSDKEKLKEIIFVNSSTLGTREYPISKTMLKRDYSTIQTKYGEVKIKNAYFDNKKISSKPEYEDCKKFAKLHNISIKDVYDAIEKNK